MFFTDLATVGSVRQTEDGYTVAVAKAVRVGVQQYLASEIGVPGGGVVNVYRPPEEVFSADSLQSFSHAPVTIGHPDKPVTADNWSEYAVGEVSTAAQVDGEWVSLPLILKDKRAADHPWRELSAGYTCNIVAEDGVAPDGTPYSYKQTNIKINHLAIVDQARAGKEARIGDNGRKWGVSPITKEAAGMELKTIVLGDEAVKVSAEDVSKIEAFKSDVAAKLSDSESKIGELTAKAAQLESEAVTDADIDARVEAKLQLLSLARSVFEGIVADGKTEEQIMREVVAHKLGDAAVDGATDSMVAGMFRVVTMLGDSSDAARNAIKDSVNNPVADYQKRIADASNKFLKGVK